MKKANKKHRKGGRSSIFQLNTIFTARTQTPSLEAARAAPFPIRLLFRTELFWSNREEMERRERKKENAVRPVGIADYRVNRR